MSDRFFPFFLMCLALWITTFGALILTLTIR